MVDQLQHEFAKTLNRHGYAFQFAVLNEAKRLRDAGQSAFNFEVSEFPVQVRGASTRIDFVLKKQDGPLRLVSECKRANPALSNWCFVGAPIVRHNRTVERPSVDRVFRHRAQIFYVEQSTGYLADNAYHLAFEVKSQAKGDNPSSRTTIEDAATQVCRGANGLIEFYLRDVELLKDVDELWFLPVIFTTAKLWVSDADLATTDLASGELNPASAKLESAAWLLYQYHISPGIKHQTRYEPKTADLGEALDKEFVRTIAVVAPDGMGAFLGWASALWLGAA